MRTRIVRAGIGLLVVAIAVITAMALGLFGGNDGTVEIRGFSYNGGDPITTANGATLTLINEDPVRHTFSVRDTPVSRMVLGFGREITLDVDIAPGTYEIYCSVEGHGQMKGTLVVE